MHKKWQLMNKYAIIYLTTLFVYNTHKKTEGVAAESSGAAP